MYDYGYCIYESHLSESVQGNCCLGKLQMLMLSKRYLFNYYFIGLDFIEMFWKWSVLKLSNINKRYMLNTNYIIFSV